MYTDILDNTSTVPILKPVALACISERFTKLNPKLLFTCIHVPDLISTQLSHPANFSNPALWDEAQIWKTGTEPDSLIPNNLNRAEPSRTGRASLVRERFQDVLYCRAHPALSCSIWLFFFCFFLLLCWLKLRRQQVCLPALCSLVWVCTDTAIEIVCACTGGVGVAPPSCTRVEMINWLVGCRTPRVRNHTSDIK